MLTWTGSYNTDVSTLVKQHEVACGIQISKKLMCIPK